MFNRLISSHFSVASDLCHVTHQSRKSGETEQIHAQSTHGEYQTHSVFSFTFFHHHFELMRWKFSRLDAVQQKKKNANKQIKLANKQLVEGSL